MSQPWEDPVANALIELADAMKQIAAALDKIGTAWLKQERRKRKPQPRNLPPEYNDQVREYMPREETSDEDYARAEEDAERVRASKEGFPDEE